MPDPVRSRASSCSFLARHGTPTPIATLARTVAGPALLRALTLVALASAGLLAGSSRTPAAAFSAKDAQVLGRTLSFLGDGMSGAMVVGVAFAPGNAASEGDAQVVRAVIGDGLSTGQVNLQIRLLTPDQLATIGHIDAIYATAGLEANMGALGRTAARLHVPILSADLACVQSDSCVVGFSSEPTVQIVIDRVAAERTGVRFVQAFRMLVREK